LIIDVHSAAFAVMLRGVGRIRALHPTMNKSLLVAVASFACLHPVAAADEPPPENPPENPSEPPPAPPKAAPAMPDSNLRVQGVFNSDLPGIERKHFLRLILHPHFGDLTHYDYMRTAVGLRYGYSSRLELSGETDVYFSHGLGDVKFFEETGFDSFRLGAKYHLGGGFWPGWDTGMGARYSFPFSGTPDELTDGFKHFTPYITFARPVPKFPGLRVFWTLGADLLTSTSVHGHHEKNDLTDDSNSVTGGFVWERGAMNYTFETTYATTRLIGHGTDDDVLTIRPGFVWNLPRKYTFNSNGQWQLGLALTLTKGPDGTEIGLGGKVRVSLNFKSMFRRKRDPQSQ
jgi:hypothetical protein